jgi:hypothetical protein
LILASDTEWIVVTQTSFRGDLKKKWRNVPFLCISYLLLLALDKTDAYGSTLLTVEITMTPFATADYLKKSVTFLSDLTLRLSVST